MQNKAIVSNVVYNNEMIGKIKVCLPAAEKELNSKDLFAIIFFYLPIWCYIFNNFTYNL